MGKEIGNGQNGQSRGQAECNKTSTKKVDENVEIVDVEAKPFTRADFIREQKQAKSNKVLLGCDLVKKTDKPGSEKKKDGQVVRGSDGVAETYPTKYFADLVFMGGTITTEIDEKQYSSLKVGCTYYCLGRIATIKDYGKEVLAPVFDSFTELYKDEEEQEH